MNLNSREIRTRLNVKSSFNRHCCRCCLNWFLQLGQRASACTFDFVRLSSVCLGCVYRLSKHFSAVHSVVIVCAGDIRLLFQLLLKFRIYCIKTYRELKLPCMVVIKISKKTSQQRWRLSFALKWNETKRHTCKQILHENIHATRE